MELIASRPRVLFGAKPQRRLVARVNSILKSPSNSPRKYVGALAQKPEIKDVPRHLLAERNALNHGADQIDRLHGIGPVGTDPRPSGLTAPAAYQALVKIIIVD